MLESHHRRRVRDVPRQHRRPHRAHHARRSRRRAARAPREQPLHEGVERERDLPERRRQGDHRHAAVDALAHDVDPPDGCRCRDQQREDHGHADRHRPRPGDAGRDDDLHASCTRRVRQVVHDEARPPRRPAVRGVPLLPDVSVGPVRLAHPGEDEGTGRRRAGRHPIRREVRRHRQDPVDRHDVGQGRWRARLSHAERVREGTPERGRDCPARCRHRSGQDQLRPSPGARAGLEPDHRHLVRPSAHPGRERGVERAPARPQGVGQPALRHVGGGERRPGQHQLLGDPAGRAAGAYVPRGDSATTSTSTTTTAPPAG